MLIDDIFKWRKTSEEKPFYNMFGVSNEVLGLDKYRDRILYKYIRGEWFKSVDYCINPFNAPIYWHYLPQRPSKEEINNVIDNKKQ